MMPHEDIKVFLKYNGIGSFISKYLLAESKYGETNCDF